jgi:hypothetical protein
MTQALSDVFASDCQLFPPSLQDKKMEHQNYGESITSRFTYLKPEQPGKTTYVIHAC